MGLPCASTLGLRIVQWLLVLIQLQTISSATANDRRYFSPQFFNEFYDSAEITNRGPSLQLLPRAEPSSNASTIVLKDKPSAPDDKLDWDDAVSKGKNLIKLLATKHLSTCGVEESNFTDEKQLFGNGWNEVFRGEPKDNTGWSIATKKLRLSEDVRYNIQYDAEQSSNVTVAGRSYRSSEGLYSNVMNTHGTIYALHNFPPRTRGASLHPPVDGSPGGEFVPLQSWADVAFIEWADACKGDEKCIKGLDTVIKCHAMSNATDRIATKALGDKHDGKTWPGKTFKNGSEELAAILATPSGRGVAWLLLTHRKGLGWKYVDSVDVWSEKEHDSEQNFFTFHIKDRNEDQESKSNEERSTPATVKRGGLIARADLWEDTVEKGKRYLSMLKCGSGTPSEFTSYQSLADWGWGTSFDSEPADGIRKEFKSAIKDVGADFRTMAIWRGITDMHTVETAHDGETYPATYAYYNNKYSAEFIIAAGNFGPEHQAAEMGIEEDFKSPKLARLSDVVFLEFQRYMASIRKPLTGLKGMLQDNVINEHSKTIAMKALGLGRSNFRMLPNWPGRKFDADSDELAALVACPNGRASVWLLAQHKEELGHKTISSARVFGIDSLLYMVFEFEDVKESSDDDDDDGGAPIERPDESERHVSGRSLTAITARGDDLMADSKWKTWVDKGKAYLDLLKCGKGTESKWTSYDDLGKYGWVRRGETHPFKIHEQSGLSKVMKYLEVSSKDEDQWAVGDQHIKETTVDGKTYLPTNARYNNKYNMELITADFNFGPRNKGPLQVPPVTGDPNPFPPLEHFSDVVYLEFVRLMKLNDRPINKLKGILRSHVVNFDTGEIAERALGMRRYEMARNKDLAWPGKDFDADSDELAALVASPNGRGVAWLLATHKELGRKTISSARVFYDSGISILFVFKDLDGEPTESHEPAEQDPSSGDTKARRDIIKRPAKHAIERRALSQKEYDEYLKKGKTLIEALESTEDCFEQSEFTDYKALEGWGWHVKMESKDPPSRAGNYPKVFDLVKASLDRDSNVVVIDEHVKKVVKDNRIYYPTGGKYMNKYNPAIIIADVNFGPAAQGRYKNPPVTGEPNPYPLLARQSDVLFLEYQRLMEDVFDHQSMDQLKAVWRHNVVNEYTRGICAKVAASGDGFAVHHIPAWPGKDFDAGSDELAALVGAPNGVAVAYLLLQHRQQLGHKKITGAKVWYEYGLHILYMISSAGDVQDNPDESTSRSRRDSAFAESLQDPANSTHGENLRPRALDQGNFDELVKKGKPLVAALQSSDDCMAQSEWTKDDALAKWGWYRMRKPKVGPVSFFTATKQVYEYVGASMEQDDNHRAYDSHSDKKEIDGVTYYKTGAEFDNRYNPALIIAENIYGVEHEGKNQKPAVTGDPNPYPKLKFWSDVTFLEYQKFMQDTGQSLDQLKAVWHRVIINPKTRNLAARLFDVEEWTDVPDWPGKDFSPGSNEFSALIGSDNGKGVVFLLLQHRKQLGAKIVTKARVWKDHTLHVLYSIDDICAGEDDAPSASDNRLVRRIDEPDSELVEKCRSDGRMLVMAQDSNVDVLKSCLDIEQNKFSEIEDLEKSGWTLLEDNGATVKDDDNNLAIFNSWVNLNLDLSGDTNSKIEYQHLKKTTGSDGVVYYPSGAYYRSLFSEEGAIAALDSKSPWNAGRDRNPRVDGKVNAFPPLKQWSDETFIVYKDVCQGDSTKMKQLKGVLRHSIVNTIAKKAINEYLGKIGELHEEMPKEWPGTLFKLGDDGFNVALGFPNGKGVAYLLATNREALGWKEVYQIRIFSASWLSAYNALYYIRDHKDNPERRSDTYSPRGKSPYGALALHNTTGLDLHQATGGSGATSHGITLSRPLGRSPIPEDLPREEKYKLAAEKGLRLLCMAHNIDPHDNQQSTYTDFQNLAQHGWREINIVFQTEDDLREDQLYDSFNALDILVDEDEIIKHEFEHIQNSQVGGHFYPYTSATYELIFNVPGNAMVATMSFGPSSRGKADNMMAGEELVALRQWSDVAFLAWQNYAQNRIKELKYVYQKEIVNRVSNDVIDHILAKRKEKLKPWPGVKISMTEEDGQALLGTPNGCGIAWLLIQHKEQLGVKVPDAVNIFGPMDGGNWQYNLCFWITDKTDTDTEMSDVLPVKRSANTSMVARPVNMTNIFDTRDQIVTEATSRHIPADTTTMHWSQRLERRLNKAIKTIWTSLWLV